MLGSGVGGFSLYVRAILAWKGFPGAGSDYLQGMCPLKAKRDCVTVEESAT